MNIHEIETELGIPRASVRYYEKEGLLSPQRGENNYRIYTQAEVETLKKIRLLRELSMPVETIRAVQRGEVSLSDALDRQSALLEGEAAKVAGARDICAALLRDRVTYPALDPARYELPAPLPQPTVYTHQNAAAPAKRDDRLPEGAVPAFSPWQRCWARCFDFALLGCLWTVVLALVFRFSAITSSSNLVQFVTTLLSWIAALLLEPLLLHTWGTTPGKWLLGLTLRDYHGKKLSYGEGLQRTWGVLSWGYGFKIPFYSLYRFWKNYRACEDCEPLHYDYELGTLYYSHVGHRWFLRAVAAVLLTLALIPIQVIASFQVMVPPNRGDITPAEFAENFNYVSHELKSGVVVNGEGYELWTGSDCYISEDGGPEVHMEYGKPVSDTPVYTLETDENGFVTAVVIENTHQGGQGRSIHDSLTILPTRDLALAIRALQGTDQSGSYLATSPLLEFMAGTDKDSMNILLQEGILEVQDAGYTLRLTLEQTGYYNGSNLFGWMTPLEDFPREKLYYHFTARLEKAD